MKTIALILLIGLLPASKNALGQKANTGFDHIALQVSDLQKSIAFYQGFVGLDTIPEPFHDGLHKWFALSVTSQFHLIETPGSQPVIPGKHLHFCFSIPSVDNLVMRLKQAGIPFEDWPGKKQSITIRPDGVKQIYLQDPDGYWIELNDNHR